MRINDSRLGRFLSVDPITKSYPELSPYQFASNRPIDGIDQDGLEWELSTIRDQNAQKAKIGVATVQLAANSSPWQKAHPGESPSRVANNPSNVGIPPYMSPSERQNAQVLFNIQLQNEGYNYDLTKKPGTKLLDNKMYQNFSNNIALPVLEIASMAEGIGGLKALFKISDKALPSRLIRVVEEKYAQSPTLGAPSTSDVFVTEASQLKGLKTSVEIAKKLTLVDKNDNFIKGPFRLIEFDTPTEGLAQPFNRATPGFINGGKTAGGATEYIIPNLKISELNNVTQTTIK